MAKKRFSDLTTTQQRLVYVLAAVEAVATTAAVRDLARRPQDEVRGPRAGWALAMVVQPVGPLAYLTVGRRPRTA